MTEDYIFRIALAPATFLVMTRYATWPLYSIALCFLFFMRKNNSKARWRILMIVQRTMQVTAVVIVASLLVAYLILPFTQNQLGVFLYAAILATLPVLIPSVISFFITPRLLDEPQLGISS